MVPNFVVLSEYSVQSAFSPERELRVFSSAHHCNDLSAAMKNHFYRKNKEMENVEQPQRQPHVDVATQGGRIGLVRPRQSSAIQTMMNHMYSQFRRAPSPRLLAVMIGELEDVDSEGKHVYYIERFEKLCVEWVRNNE